MNSENLDSKLHIFQHKPMPVKRHTTGQKILHHTGIAQLQVHPPHGIQGWVVTPPLQTEQSNTAILLLYKRYQTTAGLKSFRYIFSLSTSIILRKQNKQTKNFDYLY